MFSKGLSTLQEASTTELIAIFPPSPLAKPGINTFKLFEQLPPSVEEKLDVSALRAAVAEWDRTQSFVYPAGLSPHNFEEEVISKVPVSVLRSSGGKTSVPTVLFIHGGGFFCELANVHKSIMANIASRIACHGVLPHYSLAPEVKAPTAINEVTNILLTLLKNPEQYNLSDNIFVVGYSSGANLALNAVLNILNTPKNSKLLAKIQHIFLMSPWIDVSMKTNMESPYQHQQNSDHMLQAWGLKQMRDWYLPQGATGVEPMFSPIYRPVSEMYGMPNTTVIVGEIDRLFADAIKTVQTLRNAKITTQLVILEGQSHNHSAHAGLRDGVFSPDIIASVMQNKSIENLKGDDGLGMITNKGSYSNYTPTIARL